MLPLNHAESALIKQINCRRGLAHVAMGVLSSMALPVFEHASVLPVRLGSDDPDFSSVQLWVSLLDSDDPADPGLQ